MRSIPFLLLLFLCVQVVGQGDFSVAIISDDSENGPHRFEDNIQAEIEALLGSRYNLSFTRVYTDGEIGRITSAINRVYAANEADVLIGAGILTNLVLSNLPEYPLPTVASILLTEESTNATTRSGVPNFTYVTSPFDIEAGVKALEDICRCENLVVLINEDIQTIGLQTDNLFTSSEASISWLTLDDNLARTVPKIPAEVEAVYVLSPLSAYPTEDIKLFFDQLNERQLPSFALIDTPMLELGGYAAFAVSDNLQKIPRRVALNTEKISEGQDPKDFAVSIESFSSQLVVNMETANKVGKYPYWTVLDDALLVNVNKPYTSRVINLKSVIAEGIQTNLGYQIEAKQTEINSKDVALARSNYLPSLDVESTGFFLDQNTINSSFGTRGEFNWTAGASFSQLILSEPALANIAIQKLLLESQKRVQQQSELDVILEVAQRYFNYRQAETLVELQNSNIKAINQNLAIAKDKEEVGYSGATDVYRWQTELDLAKTDLYNANTQLKSVRYQLNESLNRPIDEEFAIEESDEMDQLIAQMDEAFINLIQDQTALDALADFMVNESMQNLPEVAQIELAIAAQERLLKSNRRSFYLPTVAFGATYDYPLAVVNPGDPIPGLEVEAAPSWNAAFNLSFPLFAGTSRKFEKEKTEVGLYQLQDQKKDVKNLLELQVRANLERVNASYNNIRLTKSAAAAAEKNIIIVQDYYKSGQVNVITLVDAQNSLLGAKINATNAVYQFMIDYFSLQRSVGNYSILSTQDQNEAFLQRFLNFKSN